MNAAVVDDISLHDLVAIRLHHLCQRPTQQVVAHVSQVQRLVRVGGGVFYHHQRRGIRYGRQAPVLVLLDLVQQAHPAGISDDQIQETLDDIEAGDHVRQVLDQILSEILCGVLRLLAAHLQEGEHDECQLSLKFLLCGAQLNHRLRHLLPI